MTHIVAPTECTLTVKMDEEESRIEFREFGVVNEVPDHRKTSSRASQSLLLESISNNLIGENLLFTGPFGLKPCIYADWTASGRSLKQVRRLKLFVIFNFYQQRLNHTSWKKFTPGMEILIQPPQEQDTNQLVFDMNHVKSLLSLLMQRLSLLFRVCR